MRQFVIILFVCLFGSVAVVDVLGMPTNGGGGECKKIVKKPFGLF